MNLSSHTPRYLARVLSRQILLYILLATQSMFGLGEIVSNDYFSFTTKKGQKTFGYFLFSEGDIVAFTSKKGSKVETVKRQDCLGFYKEPSEQMFFFSLGYSQYQSLSSLLPTSGGNFFAFGYNRKNFGLSLEMGLIGGGKVVIVGGDWNFLNRSKIELGIGAKFINEIVSGWTYTDENREVPFTYYNLHTIFGPHINLFGFYFGLFFGPKVISVYSQGSPSLDNELLLTPNLYLAIGYIHRFRR